MSEFTHAGVTYQAGKLDAMRQFHVTRRLAPFLPKLAGAGLPSDPGSLSQAAVFAFLEPLAACVAAMSDADAEYVLHTCLSVVERRQDAGGWAKVMAGGRLMFEDMDMAAMLVCAFHVLQHNLSGFFAALPSASFAAGRA